jgi:hypothetical protein
MSDGGPAGFSARLCPWVTRACPESNLKPTEVWFKLAGILA